MTSPTVRVEVENFKSFGARDQEGAQVFELRPMTYLLGANSTGKSSLFQLLLALRQSIEANRWLELLPRGHLVDLGTFRNFVHNHDENAIVRLSLDDDHLGALTLEWRVADKGEQVLLKTITIRKRGISLVLQPMSDLRYVRRTGQVRFAVKRLERDASLDADDDAGVTAGSAVGGQGAQVVLPEEVELSIDLSVTKPEWIYGEPAPVERADAKSDGEETPRPAEASSAAAESGRKLPDETLDQLISVFVHWMTVVVRARYLGPLRHPGARFASSDADVDLDVGCNGERLVDVLTGAEWIRNRVNSMLEALEVRHRIAVSNVASESGHGRLNELLLVSASSDDSDDGHGEVRCGLPDVGMGIRQVLPVLTTMATATTSDERRDENITILMIEQPELHLHPRLQVALAQVAIEALSGCVSAGHRVLFLFETHAEHMVLRTQKLVRSKAIDPSRISLLAVEPTNNGVAQVKRMDLIPSGAFRGMWPNGFFNERNREILG